MLTYKQSITAINIAEARFRLMCEKQEPANAIALAERILCRLKAKHKAHFVSLVFDNGKWI